MTVCWSLFSSHHAATSSCHKLSSWCVVCRLTSTARTRRCTVHSWPATQPSFSQTQVSAAGARGMQSESDEAQYACGLCVRLGCPYVRAGALGLPPKQAQTRLQTVCTLTACARASATSFFGSSLRQALCCSSKPLMSSLAGTVLLLLCRRQPQHQDCGAEGLCHHAAVQGQDTQL